MRQPWLTIQLRAVGMIHILLDGIAAAIRLQPPDF
jgi:hypothetical protein